MKLSGDIVLKTLLTLFGLLLIYQLIRVIFGGSWSTEELVVALLVLNISITFSLAKKVESNAVETRNLKISFLSLAKDFKALKEEHNLRCR